MGPWSFVEPRVRQQLGIQVGGRAVGERWVAEGDTLSCGSHPLHCTSQSTTFTAVTQMRYAGRRVSAPPAVGVAEVHQREAQELLHDTFRV